METKKPKVKKPFYKRWWFITLGVLFIIGAIGSSLDKPDKKADASQPDTTATTLAVSSDITTTTSAKETNSSTTTTKTETTSATQTTSTTSNSVDTSTTTTTTSTTEVTTTTEPTTAQQTSKNASASTVMGGDIIISVLDKKAEYIAITNNGSTDVNLKDWRILSVRGEQTFFFPDYVLKAGSTVAVGDSKKNTVDFHWMDGKRGIWNNSKSDNAELYNSNNELVSRSTN